MYCLIFFIASGYLMTHHKMDNMVVKIDFLIYIYIYAGFGSKNLDSYTGQFRLEMSAHVPVLKIGVSWYLPYTVLKTRKLIQLLYSIL
jgi:hypothetical protein